MQPQLSGDGQDRITGTVFLAVEDMERLRVIDGDNLLAEGELEELELLQ
jgi:hypothetical protein